MIAHDPPPRIHERRKSVSSSQGSIVRWEDERGFGFIGSGLDSDDVFVHVSAFLQKSCRPEVGDRVSYELVLDEKGRLRAAQVRILDVKQPSSVRGTSNSFVFILMVLFAVTLGGLVTLGRFPMWLVAVYFAVSLLTFAVYALDKSAARQNGWRIPEASLLLLGFLGGWPGGIIAQQWLRHKTRKVPFQTSFWFTVFCNVTIVGYLVCVGDLREVLEVFESPVPEVMENSARKDEANHLPRIIPSK